MYPNAYDRTPSIADDISKFINFLVFHGFTKTSRINIVGHSLGGQIAGMTGKRTKMTCGIIKTIFALDPAGPMFTIEKSDHRLDKDDAEYTQTIHTNAGILGFKTPLAHADFYPNWGHSQPGCGVDVR